MTSSLPTLQLIVFDLHTTCMDTMAWQHPTLQHALLFTQAMMSALSCFKIKQRLLHICQLWAEG